MKTYKVNAINSIKKLERLGFQGIDASLEESLFEYYMVWKVMEDQSLFVVHATPATWGLDHESMEFDTTSIEERDIDYWMTPENVKSVSSFVGATPEEWKTRDLQDRLFDLISYFGSENILGSSYGGFKVKK